MTQASSLALLTSTPNNISLFHFRGLKMKTNFPITLTICFQYFIRARFVKKAGESKKYNRPETYRLLRFPLRPGWLLYRRLNIFEPLQYKVKQTVIRIKNIEYLRVPHFDTNNPVLQVGKQIDDGREPLAHHLADVARKQLIVRPNQIKQGDRCARCTEIADKGLDFIYLCLEGGRGTGAASGEQLVELAVKGDNPFGKSIYTLYRLLSEHDRKSVRPVCVEARFEVLRLRTRRTGSDGRIRVKAAFETSFPAAPLLNGNTVPRPENSKALAEFMFF
jgi:hypothetical protein